MPHQRPTERRNAATTGIDLAPTDEMISLIVSEDVLAARTVLDATAAIAAVVDHAAERMGRGGRLHYFGAGASGRLAVLDATELTPTFGLEKGLALAHFPGGSAALVDSTIDFEDSRELGGSDAAAVEPGDVVIGVTASGTTRYVAGALEAARAKGCYTALITCNPDSPLSALVQNVIVLETGAEAITGSTRLKAGTATKIALNAISTAVMVKLGHTYSNLMIRMSVTNEKLEERAVELLTEATGQSAHESSAALLAAGNDIPRALVSMLGGVDASTAATALRDHGTVRAALAAIERRSA
jgi:N-acetylmuramic acid 6-phosphate etherase